MALRGLTVGMRRWHPGGSAANWLPAVTASRSGSAASTSIGCLGEFLKAPLPPPAHSTPHRTAPARLQPAGCAGALVCRSDRPSRGARQAAAHALPRCQPALCGNLQVCAHNAHAGWGASPPRRYLLQLSLSNVALVLKPPHPFHVYTGEPLPLSAGRTTAACPAWCTASPAPATSWSCTWGWG